MVEQLTLNQRVAGSSPARLTTIPSETHILPGGLSTACDGSRPVQIAPYGLPAHKTEARPAHEPGTISATDELRSQKA